MPEWLPVLKINSLDKVVAAQLICIIHSIHIVIIHINKYGDIQLFSAHFFKNSTRSTYIYNCFCWSAAETYYYILRI